MLVFGRWLLIVGVSCHWKFWFLVPALLYSTAMPLLALILVSMRFQPKTYCASGFWDFRPVLIFARWLAGRGSAWLLQVSWGLCELVLGGGSAKMWVHCGISGWAQHCQVRQTKFCIKNVFQFLNCFIFVWLQKFAKSASANRTPNRFLSHYLNMNPLKSSKKYTQRKLEGWELFTQYWNVKST